jgi:NAD(P)-dependent dehydrogenase (short-subunit alcohol dehydrogenase family)
MHILTASFRQRKKGTIINIASRSATVNSPFSANYAAAKAALVRASGCLQFELDMDGLEDIGIYSLHPGATKTNIQKPLPQDVAARYPEAAEAYAKFTAQFPCDPSLCGQTCVYLAAGRGKALRGRYFDCEQDVGYVSSMRDLIKEEHLYELKVDFLGGLPNDGGNMPDSLLTEL